MRRIESRIRKLEAQLQLDSQPQVTGLGCLWRRLPWERKQNLAPGERIVVDWYRNWGTMTHGRERVTPDPEDHGRACKPGGYLLDVLEELHQNCSFKDKTGSCGDCADTPVAEQLPSNCSSSSEEGPPISGSAESIILEDDDGALNDNDDEENNIV